MVNSSQAILLIYTIGSSQQVVIVYQKWYLEAKPL